MGELELLPPPPPNKPPIRLPIAPPIGPQAASNRGQAASNAVGAQIGAAFGQGLAGGLFGESDAIKQARMQAGQEEQVREFLGKVNWDSPEDLSRASKMLMKVSPEAGIRLGQEALKIDKANKEAKQKEMALEVVGNYAANPFDDELYTQAIKLTGDYEGLSKLRQQKEQEAYSTYGKVARDLGYAPGSPEFIDYVSDATRKEKASADNALVGKINPQFYTPESVAAFEQSRLKGTVDYGLLKPTDSLTPFAQQEQVKQSIKQINTRNDKFAVQQNTFMKVKELQNLLDKGLKTGITEDLLLPVKKVASELTGANFDDVPEQELFNALSNQLALMIRNPDSGMGLPGATSNRDISFLTASVSRLAGTPEGNKLILKQYEKLYDFNKDIIDFQNKLIEKNNGVVPFDLESKLSDYGSKYKFYTEEERKEIIDSQVSSILSPETQALLGDNSDE